MSEKNLTNLPLMSVDDIVTSLSNSYIILIKKNLPFKRFPSVMLWGPPGVGKSQSIREIAKHIETVTNKKVNVTDVRLLLFNPIDLRGIPTSNEDKTLAIWLKPKIFQMDDSKDVVNILFLDEISACPQSVQAAAYQITLDRVVGEHKLPDNCIVIAAGNRITDKSVVTKMPRALANRLMHIEVDVNVASWLDWANKNGINNKVIKFIKDNPKKLIDSEANNEDLAYPTPRTWQMVSDILNDIDDENVEIINFIAGLVGRNIATEFSMYLKIKDNVPNVEDIFNGNAKYEKMSTEGLFYLKNMILDYVKTEKLSDSEMRNGIKYILDMPSEYSLILIRNFLKVSDNRNSNNNSNSNSNDINNIKKIVLSMPEVSNWMSKTGKMLSELK